MPIKTRHYSTTTSTKQPPKPKSSIVNLINFLILMLLITIMIVIGVVFNNNQKNLRNTIANMRKDLQEKIIATDNNLQQQITQLEEKTKSQPQPTPKNDSHQQDLLNIKKSSDDNLPNFEPMSIDKFANLDGLVGMKNYKDLVKPFINTIRHPDCFKGRGKLELSNGLLLYGCPGTGKTVGVRALAKELGMPYFEVPSGIFARSYRGEATMMVKKLFKQAREIAKKNKGAVILLDECESIFLKIADLPKDAEVRNVVNQFKVELESPEKDPDHPLIIIGATNNLHDIDSAIQSRFTNKLEIKPDDFDGRKEQLKFILEKTHHFPITKEAKEYLLNTINKALDYLLPDEDYKKAYRMLLNYLKETNNRAINRTVDDKINNKVCDNPKHNELHKNNEQVENGSKDKNILGNCCSCKAITVDDLKNMYLITMDPTGYTLKFVESQQPKATGEQPQDTSAQTTKSSTTNNEQPPVTQTTTTSTTQTETTNVDNNKPEGKKLEDNKPKNNNPEDNKPEGNNPENKKLEDEAIKNKK